MNAEGGRDFDEILFNHFTAEFKEEYKINVFQNAKAGLKLQSVCEKLEKVLSANPVAHLNIKCLNDEKDVRGFIKRDEFEQISVPILGRLMGLLEEALSNVGLLAKNIHAGHRRNLNASERVDQDCVQECAILSLSFKMREFQVNESFPFTILQIRRICCCCDIC